jgi:hypothetical protein
MHTTSEVCVDRFQAERAPGRRYRTSPLTVCGPIPRPFFPMTGVSERCSMWLITLTAVLARDCLIGTNLTSLNS